jgi:N4-gp56 family major capsid protein
MAQQEWAVDTLGGFYSNNELSKQSRFVSQPMFRFRQFVEVKNAKGKGKGDKLFYDKHQNVATQGTALTETTTIPETNYTIKQGTLTITEYGNAIPYTQKLETLSELDVNSSVVTSLRNDAAKALDSAAAAQFVSAEWRYVCTSGTSSAVTTNGTFTATATSDLNAFHIRRIVLYFKTHHIQPYDGVNFVGILSPEASYGVTSDTTTGGWIDASKYTGQYASNLFNGEIGKFLGVRFVEETNYLSNTIGNTSIYGEAVFLGADAIAEGVAVPEELRAKIPQDYGRDKGIAWYSLLGYQKIWSQSGDGEEHLIYVGSA